jgi:hypothetical protein
MSAFYADSRRIREKEDEVAKQREGLTREQQLERRLKIANEWRRLYEDKTYNLDHSFFRQHLVLRWAQFALSVTGVLLLLVVGYWRYVTPRHASRQPAPPEGAERG